MPACLSDELGEPCRRSRAVRFREELEGEPARVVPLRFDRQPSGTAHELGSPCIPRACGDLVRPGLALRLADQRGSGGEEPS